MKENTNKERDSRFSLEEQIKAAKFIGEEIGFSKDIGLEVMEVSEGYCKGRIALHKRHMNPLNTVHGGVFFTLADTICGIAAAASGTVEYAGWISGYGNTVIINHGGGVTTLYGHNQSLAASVGQQVSQGETIAYCGSTGNSTGPHCHFEVRQNGSPVSPYGYL